MTITRSRTNTAVISGLLVCCGCAPATSTGSATPNPLSATPNTVSSSSSAAHPSPTPTSDLPAGSTPLGKPAKYVGSATPWQITLQTVRCGLNTVPGAQLNPSWNGASSAPQYVAIRPSRGKRFCQLTWQWKNLGRSAVTIGIGGDLLLNGQTLPRADDETLWSLNTTRTQLGIDLTSPIPPGGTTRRIDVYEVAAKQMPAGVWAPQAPSPILFATHAH